MSFTCDICGTAQEAGTKPKKVILEKREKVYPPQELPKRKQTGRRFRNEDGGGGYRRRNEPEYGNEGHGWEIAKDANACPDCVAKM